MTKKFFLIGLLSFIFLPALLQAQETHHQAPKGKSGSIPAAALMGADTLKDLLASSKKGALVVIHTGPPQLFKKGHIPGAIAVGQVADSAGATALIDTLTKLPKKQQIVLYCGCCPWKNCPNVHPAYNIAHEMGLTNVKVLDIPDNFRLDWEKKGYPVEK